MNMGTMIGKQILFIFEILFIILIHAGCSKPRCLLEHFFMSSTLHFLGIYVCQGSAYLIKKKLIHYYVRELLKLFINYINAFVPQKDRAEKMDIAMLQRALSKFFYFLFSHNSLLQLRDTSFGITTLEAFQGKIISSGLSCLMRSHSSLHA